MESKVLITHQPATRRVDYTSFFSSTSHWPHISSGRREYIHEIDTKLKCLWCWRWFFFARSKTHQLCERFIVSIPAFQIVFKGLGVSFLSVSSKRSLKWKMITNMKNEKLVACEVQHFLIWNLHKQTTKKQRSVHAAVRISVSRQTPKKTYSQVFLFAFLSLSAFLAKLWPTKKRQLLRPQHCKNTLHKDYRNAKWKRQKQQ